jgi:nitrogen-specific signal transduction histidine kinase
MMSMIHEALRKAEENRVGQSEKDIAPVHELEKPDPSDGISTPLSPSFLIQILQDIRRTVTSIYEIHLLSMREPNHDEMGKHCSKAMTQGFHRIVSVLDMLSSYIHMASPIIKKNTLNRILEEILESKKKKFRAENITLMRHFDKELPETILHDEQVRFILSSVLQYVIHSTPPGGSIEIVTRFVHDQKGQGLISIAPLKNQYSEILIFSSYPQSLFHKLEGTAVVPDIEKNGASHLLLGLVKEMIRRSQSRVEFQMDQMKSQTRISLKFPVERRQVACYHLDNL